jgi:hypothetical protein
MSHRSRSAAAARGEVGVEDGVRKGGVFGGGDGCLVESW